MTKGFAAQKAQAASSAEQRRRQAFCHHPVGRRIGDVCSDCGKKMK